MAKVIIDADPGVDDAFAITLACKSKFIELLGITVVAGNCGLENAIRNTFKILDLCDKYYIPVYRGAEVSLKDKQDDASYVHGYNGFGGVSYEPVRRSTNGDAIDFLIKTVNDNPGQIDVVALGPLTNIALAILKNKEFVHNIKSLNIMGCAKVKGNVTKYSEFNIFQDAEAAKIVFESEIKNIVVMGLDVTTKLPLSTKCEKFLLNQKNEIADMLYAITRKGTEFERKHGFDGIWLNDPLLIVYLIDSSVVNLMNVKIDIDTKGEILGKSNVKLTDNSNIKYAYDVKPTLFYKILFETIFEENKFDWIYFFIFKIKFISLFNFTWYNRRWWKQWRLI